MNSEKDTLPNNQVIFDAIKDLQTVIVGLNTKIENLHSEMNTRFEQVDKKFEQVDKRFEQVDKRFEHVDRRFEQIDGRFEQVDKHFEQIDIRDEEMRLQIMSFDVRLDRVEASIYEVLHVTLNTRADVKVLREEVHFWVKEVRELQLKVA